MFILLGNSRYQEWSTIDSMETMFLVFLGTLALSFGIAYISIFSKLKKTQFLLAELYLKNSALEELFLKTKVSDIDSGEDIHKENFIKFLSDSRDWAFEYIETSQKVIKEVSKELSNKGLNNYSEKLMALLPDAEIKG